MEELKTGSALLASARKEGNAVIASVRGEIDLHNSADLRAALLAIIHQHRPAKLVLNLSGVPYMDSSAIAVLVESLQKVRKTGGKIFLTDLQPRVKGLLEIARLHSIFVMVKDEEEAMKEGVKNEK
jgi:anti-sigma B factor antagonist